MMLPSIDNSLYTALTCLNPGIKEKVRENFQRLFTLHNRQSRVQHAGHALHMRSDILVTAEHAVHILFGQHQHVHIGDRTERLVSGTGEDKVSLSKKGSFFERLHHFRRIFISDDLHLENRTQRLMGIRNADGRGGEVRGECKASEAFQKAPFTVPDDWSHHRKPMTIMTKSLNDVDSDADGNDVDDYDGSGGDCNNDRDDDDDGKVGDDDDADDE